MPLQKDKKNAENITLPPLFQRVSAWLIAILIVVLIYFYFLEMKYIENTFRAGKLVLWSVLTGMTVGALTGYYFSRKGSEMMDKIRTFMIFFILIIFFAPLIGSLTNRWFASQPIEEAFEIFEVQQVALYPVVGETRPQKSDVNVFILHMGALEKIRIENVTPNSIQKGDSLSLKIRRGFWGYDFFEAERMATAR